MAMDPSALEPLRRAESRRQAAWIVSAILLADFPDAKEKEKSKAFRERVQRNFPLISDLAKQVERQMNP